jgi:hypothetical protein
MAPPAIKRFDKRYLPIADAIASVDLDQEDRELVALAVTEALKGQPDFRADLFGLLASDPLVPCAGPEGSEDGCPHGRIIRIGMHLRDGPDGRSYAWRRRAPYGVIRCVSCGVPNKLGISDSEMS